MTKTELTLTGPICKIEKFGKWVAFVLTTESKTKFSTKVILHGKKAQDALKEVSKGSTIMASGSVFKVEGNALKLFADECFPIEAEFNVE